MPKGPGHWQTINPHGGGGPQRVWVSDQKDTPKATEYQVQRGDKGTHGRWDAKAVDGREVKANELDKLANALEDDLKNLKKAFSKVLAEGKFDRSHVGDFGNSLDLAKQAADSHKAFDTYYDYLAKAYQLLINNLRDSAKDARKTEQKTDDEVRRIKPHAGPPTRPNF